MPQDCLFCKIVNKEIPAQIVGENDQVLAFKDISPRAPVHFLIIPKKHYATLNDLDDPNTLGAMGRLAVELAKEQGIADSGYRTVINTNSGAGQTVFHLHMHLMGGRAMAWPPG